MKEMMNWIANEEEGQGMVEYALILALIAIAALAVLPAIGEKITDIFTSANTKLQGVDTTN